MEDSNKTNITDITEITKILDSYLCIQESDEKPYLILDSVRIIL